MSAERRAWSASFSMPFGLSMASLAKSTSLGTPRRVPVVLKTFRRSESGPRRKDWTKKKTIEQNKILRLLSTLGGNGFGGGRVRYAVFKALRWPYARGSTNVNSNGQNGLILLRSDIACVAHYRDLISLVSHAPR